MKIYYTSITTTINSSQPLARSLHQSVFVHGASTTPHILTLYQAKTGTQTEDGKGREGGGNWEKIFPKI